MGKTNFKTLKNLVGSLSDKLHKLSEGELNLEEIESLTENARELYERIVVIRYKSYESISSTLVQTQKDPISSEDTDIIEKDPEEMMMFDFSSNDDIPTNSETVKSKEKEKVPQINKEEKNEASLNDNFKKTDGSVAGKFEKAPIADLKEHIGINRKFLYVNELFKGDSSMYNATIDKLNSYNSVKEALEKVNSLAEENGWDPENIAVSGFIELVERRYLG